MSPLVCDRCGSVPNSCHHSLDKEDYHLIPYEDYRRGKSAVLAITCLGIAFWIAVAAVVKHFWS